MCKGVLIHCVSFWWFIVIISYRHRGLPRHFAYDRWTNAAENMSFMGLCFVEQQEIALC